MNFPRTRHSQVLNYAKEYKKVRNEAAWHDYVKDLEIVEAKVRALIGSPAHNTPINLARAKDMLSYYHTHDILGPYSKNDMVVLMSIKDHQKMDQAVAAWAEVDRATRRCPKAELKLFSTSGSYTETGIVIWY